jgi:hypothetical protein
MFMRPVVCLVAFMAIVAAVAGCDSGGRPDSAQSVGSTGPTASSHGPISSAPSGVSRPGSKIHGHSGSSPTSRGEVGPPIEGGYTDPPEEGKGPKKKPPDGKKPPDRKSIIVAGPTLSDEYPAAFGWFPDPGIQCGYMTFHEAPPQSVKVVSVSVPAPWRLTTGESECGQRLPEESGGAPYCVGYTFSPGSTTGCKLALELPESADGNDYYGLKVVMTLDVTCTDRQGEICSKVPVELDPSPSSPVKVVSRYTHGLQACLKTVPDGSATGPGGGEAYLETDTQCRLPATSST